MRILGLGFVAFLLMPPASVYAQSVKIEDLVGTWVKSQTPAATLSIRADSTFSFKGRNDFQRWNYLRGDTLSFLKNGACIAGTKTCKSSAGTDYCWDGTSTGSGAAGGDCLRGEPGYAIMLKDQQLTLNALEGTSDSGPEGTYTRIETPKPAP